MAKAWEARRIPPKCCEGEKSHADAQDGELGAEVVKAGHAEGRAELPGQIGECLQQGDGKRSRNAGEGEGRAHFQGVSIVQRVEHGVEQAEERKPEPDEVEVRRAAHRPLLDGDTVDAERFAQGDERHHDCQHEDLDEGHDRHAGPHHGSATRGQGEGVGQIVRLAGVHAVEERHKDAVNEDGAVHPRGNEDENPEQRQHIGGRVHDEAKLLHDERFHATSSFGRWVMMSSRVAGRPMLASEGTSALSPAAVRRSPSTGASVLRASGSGATA